MSMGVGTLISLEEYLNTSYSPDREYVDGTVVERLVGERLHSLTQSNIIFALRTKYPNIRVWPELRVRTLERRCRIPGVCVTLEDPGTPILESAPFIAIEILSRGDALSDLMEKIQEYRSIGTPYIWVLDPHRRKVFAFGETRGLYEVPRPRVATENPELELLFDEIF